MLDASVAYNRYRFIGHEFLTWLWFMIDNDKAGLLALAPELADIYIGNRVALENSRQNREESIIIRGDGAGLEEGLIALAKGAKVTEMNLVVKSGENQWRFTLRGESLNIGSLKPPETGRVETSEDIEGAVLEKIYLYEKPVTLVRRMYQRFIQLRVTPDWENKTACRISDWVEKGS